MYIDYPQCHTIFAQTQLICFLQLRRSSNERTVEEIIADMNLMFSRAPGPMLIDKEDWDTIETEILTLQDYKEGRR